MMLPSLIYRLLVALCYEQDRLHDGCQLHVDENDVLCVFLLCHFVGSFTHQEGIRRLIYNEHQI